MLAENVTGLAPLSGVVEWYVPIHVLQKHVGPRLSESAAWTERSRVRCMGKKKEERSKKSKRGDINEKNPSHPNSSVSN